MFYFSATYLMIQLLVYFFSPGEVTESATIKKQYIAHILRLGHNSEVI